MVVNTESCVTEQCRVRILQHGTLGLANTIRELGHEAQVRIWTDAAAARGLTSPKRERRNQAYGDEVLWAAAEREEPGAQDREDPRHSQSRRLADETSGWETFGDVVRAVEHQAS